MNSGLPAVIAVGGCPINKIPAPLNSGVRSFLFSNGCKLGFAPLKNKKSLPDKKCRDRDFIEVSGGFEPPYTVLQTAA